ncbi:MAG: hypothetical protein KKF52_05735 [Nanoarchaeota archaeon]|nr:hypothetical protein [Nanoarchaeota archaeon]
MVNNMKTIFAWLITLMFLGSGFAYAGDYALSAHGNSTDGVSGRLGSYGKGNCAHCHEQHASLGGVEPTPPPQDGAPDNYLLFTEWSNNNYNSFCMGTCHDGGAGEGDNIATQYGKSYHHPTSGVHTFGEDDPADFASRHGYCIDCHNPHVAKKIDRTVGSNLVAGGPLLKVSGVSVTNPATAWTAPSYAFIPASTGITKEYQLCFKCHSSWTTQPTGPPAQTNIALQFNTSNPSAHPVEAGLTASSSSALTITYMTGWQSVGTQTMYCSDCHGEDGGTVKGPHGSDRDNILEGYWPKNAAAAFYTLGNVDSNCLCINCHVVTNTNDVHEDNNHSTSKCVNCHVGLPHGINRKRLIAYVADLAPYDYGDANAEITAYTWSADPEVYAVGNCTAPGSACTSAH